MILSKDDQKTLLSVAREAIELKVQGLEPPTLDIKAYSPALREPRACFVTLTKRGELRGCVGTVEIKLPLVEEVQQRAVMAALQDRRFPPVAENELPEITIEISCLSLPRSVFYRHPDDLIEKIQVGEDGVILSDGVRKATFLPQVWEKMPDVETFLTKLCCKMGVKGTLWREKPLKVQTYRVDHFRESSS